jgi:hypothetical protein
MTRRIRLTLEPLDGRELPGTLVTSDGPQVGTEPAAAAQNQKPVISNFKAVVGANGVVTFSGLVTDDSPVAGYVVHIIGGNGINLSAVVQSDGTFQVSTFVSGSSDVTVEASVTDSQGATSDPAYTTFTPSA